MKTALTKEIDGYNIITGFDKLTIDPMATRERVQSDIKKEHEFIVLDSAITRLNGIKNQIEDAKNKGNNITAHVKKRYFRNNPDLLVFSNEFKITDDILTDKEKNDLSRINANLKFYFEEHEKAGQAKIEAENKLKKKSAEFFNKNPIYFEPKIGEVVLSNEKYNKLKDLVENNKPNKIDIDGNIIIDMRGIEYIDSNGKRIKITILGEQPNGSLVSELTENEIEDLRISGLTIEEKENELKIIINGIANHASVMRSKLEIQGDDDALIKAREWYNQEVLKVRNKYGIE